MSAAPKPVDDAPKETCGNCGQAPAKQRCTRCKKQFYCSRDCQKSDWQFHRRVCVSPSQKKKEEDEAAEAKRREKKRKLEKKAEKAAAAPKPAAAADGETKSKPVVTKGGTDKAEVGEEDAEALAAVKKGYRYFSRELPEHEKELIGDIMPKKLGGSEGEASGAGGGAGGAPAPAPAAPPMERGDSKLSSWNSNTWEERDWTDWAKERLTTHLTAIEAEMPELPFGGGSVTGTGHTAFDGFLNVLFVRGKKRHAFDFNFKAQLDVMVAKEEGEDPKATKMIVHFSDVSADDEVYDTVVSWGSPKPPRAARDLLARAAKGPSGALYTHLAGAIARLLSDFRTEK